MNCHNCNKPLQEGFKFCPNCGAEAMVNKFCPNCRGEVKPDWKACPNCGTALNRGGAPIQQQAKPNYYPKHGSTRSNSSGRYYGSSSNRKRGRRKGFLGNLFSS